MNISLKHQNNIIFVDTAGWGNLFDCTQPFHSQTVKIYRDARQNSYKIITSNYIISELVALLDSPLHIPRLKLINIISSIKESSYVDTIYINEKMDQDAWTLLKERPDKKWSLVDCSSFVIMKYYNISFALTSDHHFEQAGFVRLLKSNNDI